MWWMGRPRAGLGAPSRTGWRHGWVHAAHLQDGDVVRDVVRGHWIVGSVDDRPYRRGLGGVRVDLWSGCEPVSGAYQDDVYFPAGALIPIYRRATVRIPPFRALRGA